LTLVGTRTQVETHLARTQELLKTINESVLSPLAPWMGGADGGGSTGVAAATTSMVGGMSDSYRSGIQIVHTSYGNISLQTLSLDFRGTIFLLVDLSYFVALLFVLFVYLDVCVLLFAYIPRACIALLLPLYYKSDVSEHENLNHKPSSTISSLIISSRLAAKKALPLGE
jgi:hypothetical protein